MCIRDSPQTVDEHPQRAGRGDPRVLLAQRAGRAIAGVGEGLPAGLDERGVELLEGCDGEEDLTAHLEDLGMAGPGEPVRDAVDRHDISGDVLACPPVPAGRCTDEPPAFVEQVDCCLLYTSRCV